MRSKGEASVAGGRKPFVGPGSQGKERGFCFEHGGKLVEGQDPFRLWTVVGSCVESGWQACRRGSWEEPVNISQHMAVLTSATAQGRVIPGKQTDPSPPLPLTSVPWRTLSLGGMAWMQWASEGERSGVREAFTVWLWN